MSYNGYENYETFSVHLWLSNEKKMYDLMLEFVKSARELTNIEDDEHSILSRKEQTKNHLAAMIRTVVEEDNPLKDDDGLYSDLLLASLSDVNWFEIARSFLEEQNDDKS